MLIGPDWTGWMGKFPLTIQAEPRSDQELLDAVSRWEAKDKQFSFLVLGNHVPGSQAVWGSAIVHCSLSGAVSLSLHFVKIPLQLWAGVMTSVEAHWWPNPITLGPYKQHSFELFWTTSGCSSTCHVHRPSGWQCWRNCSGSQGQMDTPSHSSPRSSSCNPCLLADAGGYDKSISVNLRGIFDRYLYRHRNRYTHCFSCGHVKGLWYKCYYLNL